MVLDVDPSKRRISLGLKQAMANPWEAFVEEHPVGSELEGEVKNITEFGLFVGLPGDIDGMVHLSDLDWDEAGRGGDRRLQQGRHGQGQGARRRRREGAHLARHQAARRRPVEAATPSQEGRRRHLHRDRDHTRRHRGRRSATACPGFIRKSELSRDRGEQRPDRFAVGDKVDAKITTIDKAARRVVAVDQGARDRRGEAGDGRVRLVRLAAPARRHPGRGDPRQKQEEQTEGLSLEGRPVDRRPFSWSALAGRASPRGAAPLLDAVGSLALFRPGRRRRGRSPISGERRRHDQIGADASSRRANPHLYQRDIERIVSDGVRARSARRWRAATGSSCGASARSRSRAATPGSAATRAPATRCRSRTKHVPFFKTGKELRERLNVSE